MEGEGSVGLLVGMLMSIGVDEMGGMWRRLELMECVQYT